MRLLRTKGAGSKEAAALLTSVTDRGNASYERALPVARRLVRGVRQGGDATLLRYRAKLDGIASSEPLRVSEEEIRTAWEGTPKELRDALRFAAKNIRAFAEKQRPKDWTMRPAPGVVTGQRVVPLKAVGCYVPSGRYPLPSTLLMTVIPAQVAGVKRIAVISPRPARETMAAAFLLGVTEFYRIGGAHGIAALAYGTESIAGVERIVGPGNAYVTAAKKLVSADCGIDMLAGPTEIVVTSEQGEAAGIAADLVAQAEHDPDAVALLLTSKVELARAVIDEVKRRVRDNAIARTAIARSGAALVTATPEEARILTNRIAPEHLTVDSEADLEWVRNAGSVFVGRYSAQPLGDYISGPNHTLPTSGLARLRGGLSVLDFLKIITVQQYTAEGVRRLGAAAIALAKAEGLTGHAEAIRAREAPMAELMPRDAVVRMKEYHPPLGDRSGVRLDFNENTFACSPRVQQALQKISAADLTRYPERGPVEAAVAEHLGVTPAQVLLTNGVDEAIHVLCQTYLNAGDEMLLPVPTYTMYEVYASSADAKVVQVPAGAGFAFPVEALLEAITPATKLIAIANPNSPTGRSVTRESILRVLRHAPHAAVLVDEAYFHFHGETVLDLIGSEPNLIVARTFSKAYGLAGLRLGMLAASEEQMRWMRRVISPYSVNSLALACLPPALEDTEYLAWYISEVLASRTILEKALDEPGVPRWPSDANFVLTRIGPRHRELVEGMRRRGVLVRDRSSDPGCEGCVRITVGPREHTQKGIAALQAVLQEMGWTRGKA